MEKFRSIGFFGVLVVEEVIELKVGGVCLRVRKGEFILLVGSIVVGVVDKLFRGSSSRVSLI